MRVGSRSEDERERRPGSGCRLARTSGLNTHLCVLADASRFTQHQQPRLRLAPATTLPLPAPSSSNAGVAASGVLPSPGLLRGRDRCWCNAATASTTTTCLLGPLRLGRQRTLGCRSATYASAPIVPRESADMDDERRVGRGRRRRASGSRLGCDSRRPRDDLQSAASEFEALLPMTAGRVVLLTGADEQARPVEAEATHGVLRAVARDDTGSAPRFAGRPARHRHEAYRNAGEGEWTPVARCARSERPTQRLCAAPTRRGLPTSAIRWFRASAASRRDDESERRRRRGWRSDAWQRHSEAGAAGRAEAVVPRPARARLDVVDRDSARFAGRRFRASTITSCVGTDCSGDR